MNGTVDSQRMSLPDEVVDRISRRCAIDDRLRLKSLTDRMAVNRISIEEYIALRETLDNRPSIRLGRAGLVKLWHWQLKKYGVRVWNYEIRMWPGGYGAVTQYITVQHTLLVYMKCGWIRDNGQYEDVWDLRFR